MGLLARALKNKLTTNDASPLTGKGLEDVVRDVLDQTLRKRMNEYVLACGKDGKPPAPEVVKLAEKLSSNKAGPTFGDYRVLARHIPAVKEVVMTGTYTTEHHTEKSGKKGKKLEDGNDDGQLYVFDADSEPDLEVAIAVHASASFPGAFKPIDVKLASGLTVTLHRRRSDEQHAHLGEHRQRARPRPDAAAARRDLRLRRRGRLRRQPAQGPGESRAGIRRAHRRLVRRQQERRRRVRQEQVGGRQAGPDRRRAAGR